jgi:glycosyltransferase involved in cell wall biosynthesis
MTRDDKDRLSIVHVMGQLQTGGAEKMLLNLCEVMPSSRFRQTVISMAGAPGDLSEAFLALGVPEVICRLEPRPRFARRFIRALRGTRPDVLVSHISLASALVLLLGAWARVPRRIAVFHSDGDGKPQTPRRRIYRAAMRILLRRVATDVVGVTASTLAFSGVTDDRGTVIPNAVDLRHPLPADRRAAARALGLETYECVIAHVGRGAAEKNRGVLPDVMRRLPERCGLVLAGAEDIADLRLEAQDPLQPRIRNLGTLPTAFPLLAAADVLLLPSVREGLPLVILEALSMGCPVVASNLPGIRELAAVLPGITLVDDPADVAGFASAVEAALRTSDSPADMRRHLVAARYDLASVASRWEDLCDASQ